MNRYELSDTEWDRIKDLLPTLGNAVLGGRPSAGSRHFINAIFWVLRSGAPWRDLPERYGPWKTAYNRFNLWRQAGLFDKVLEALQIRLDREGHIDWDLWCIDGSSVRAAKAAAGAGKRGARTNPETTLWAARAADGAASSTWLLMAAEFLSPWASRPVNGTNRLSSKR